MDAATARDASPPETSGRQTGPWVLAGLCAAAYLAIASVGITRSYQYDEAVTVGFFVRRSSFVDAVTAQINFTNHPLLTAVSWVVHRVGGTSEAWLRAAPLAAAAMTVAVVAHWCARRWGRAAATVAAAAVTLNPMFLDITRQVRGYSFAILAVAGGTVLVAERRERFTENRVRAAYALLVAAALLSHLYSALAIVGHGAHVWRRSPAGVRGWMVATGLGGCLALLIYAPALLGMLGDREQAHPFTTSVLEFGEQLFGGRVAGAVGVAVLALLVVDNRRPAAPFALALAGSFAAMSIVVVTVFLPRFVAWAIPLGAMLAARTVSRRRWTALPMAALLVLLIPAAVETVRSSTSNRDVARAGLELRAAGEEVCTADFYWEEYYVYGDFPQTVFTDDCTLVIVRRADLDSSEVAGLSFARIPGVDDVCIAGDAAVLRRRQLDPASCTE